MWLSLNQENYCSHNGYSNISSLDGWILDSRILIKATSKCHLLSHLVPFLLKFNSPYWLSVISAVGPGMDGFRPHYLYCNGKLKYSTKYSAVYNINIDTKRKLANISFYLLSSSITTFYIQRVLGNSVLNTVIEHWSTYKGS